MDIEKHIAVVKDFPKKGIIFKDISPIFLNPNAFSQLIDELAESVRDLGATKYLRLKRADFCLARRFRLSLACLWFPCAKRANSRARRLKFLTVLNTAPILCACTAKTFSLKTRF